MKSQSIASEGALRIPFRYKFYALTLLSVAVPLLIVAMLAIVWSHSSLAETGREQNQIILSQMQTILRLRLDQLTQTVDSMADAGAVRATFDFSATNGFVPAQLKNELQSIANRLPLVTRIRAIDAGEHLVADTRIGDNALGDAARGLLAKLRNLNSQRDSESRFELIDSQPRLLVMRRVLGTQDKSLAGYLLVDVALEELFESVRNLRFDNCPHAFAFVIDEHKRFLAHPVASQVLQPATADNLDLGLLAQIDLAPNVAWHTSNIYGADFYCSTAQIDNPRWVLGVAIPQWEFDASIIALSRNLLLVTVAAVTIAMIAGCGISRYTTESVEQLTVKSSQLEQSRHVAETANRAKCDFLANMSHEVRTPLNGILGYTELLLRGADGGNESDRRDFLTTIRESGRHLLQLINDILDISKFESGQFRVDRVECSPDQIVTDVATMFRMPAAQKGITLDYVWEGRVPATVQTDPFRLKQLLVNLVNNAVKFTERGAVKLVARMDDTDSGPKLRLEVHDTGIGIPEDKLAMIFQPFMQSDTSVTRKYGGTGLGLAISRKIAASLGGDLTVESFVGKGSVVTATIATGDLHGVKFTDLPASSLAGIASHAVTYCADLEGVKVLIVDDAETNRKLVNVFLSRSGAAVAMAENGAVALRAVANAQFDLILMDMQLPDVDGYTAASRLREQGFKGPIIALTAHAMRGDREKCLLAGCSSYVSKPINMDELMVAVRDAVGTVHDDGDQHPEDNGHIVSTVKLSSALSVA